MIKHYYLFIALLIIATAPRCHAMENTAPYTFMESSINMPQQVICFPNKIVAIAGKIKDLNYGCSLYDLSTNKEIGLLIGGSADSLIMAAHPDKTKLAICSYDNHSKRLTIFDIEKRTAIWEKISDDFRGAPIFNQHDGTILIGHDRSMDSFNYTNNTHTSSPWEYNLGHPNNAFHPTKQEYFFFDRINDCVFIVQPNQTPYIKRHLGARNVYSCKYSPDGSLIAMNNTNHGFSIINPELDNSLYTIDQNKTQYCSIIFHPTSFILAGLSSFGRQVDYLDTKTKKFITTTKISYKPGYQLDFVPFYFNRIDFSCDGTQLIVAHDDKCLVLKVPFEALYKNITKDQCIFAYLILQHYFHDETALPSDIRHLLIKYLLATSKYSLTNH